ncbi:FAD/NAD(P)-binding protein, partial [Xanthomonas arboricola]|uniref:FAD/NAD(P)-binding protein n=1 Tax=Xanthomonas arboricola TaxID=56448 RepID=UPI0021589833
GDAVIAIVGGGASGVLVALQLLRQAVAPVQIVLIEPHAVLGEGVAYSTARPEHLLNVPAARMSALVEAPQDFVDYLRAHARPAGVRASRARSAGVRRSAAAAAC